MYTQVGAQIHDIPRWFIKKIISNLVLHDLLWIMQGAYTSWTRRVYYKTLSNTLKFLQHIKRQTDANRQDLSTAITVI